MSQLKAFIAEARKNPEIQRELEGCALESWGDCHTPLDVDSQKVISVASRAGFCLTHQDLIKAQCEHLDHFWRFEMENSFVARRFLSRVQFNLSADVPQVDYYY